MISQRGTAIKRRPKDFNTLEGQHFIVQTLKNSIENNMIANAYIFSGPRGVGKTSSARAFSRCLICKQGPTTSPCGLCVNCNSIDSGSNLDIIEIDGASNTSVQDVRLIKEELMFPPAVSRYRIYIIDEVHMLSNSAFNALLKIVEEPPNYIIFIFATTEIHKVPETIKSRCQQFNFKLLPIKKIYDMLEKICIEENIKYEQAALMWISCKSEGSVRDSYTLFDQIVAFSSKNINLEQIKLNMGLTSDEFLEKLIFSIINSNTNDLIEILAAVFLTGISAEQFLTDSIEFFREILFFRLGIRNENFVGFKADVLKEECVKLEVNYIERILSVLLETYRNLQFTVNARFELELVFIRIIRLKDYIPTHVLIKQLEKLEDTFMQDIDLDTGNLSNNDDLEEDLDFKSKVVESTDPSLSSKTVCNSNEPDDVDLIFVDNDSLIKETFIYFIGKYLQTLMYAGEIKIDKNNLYYKIFNEFEFNEFQAYKMDIIRDFNMQHPRICVIIEKCFEKLVDDELDNKINILKDIFGAEELKE